MAEFLYDPKFDLCRRHVELARQHGMDWETLKTLGMPTDQLDDWLLSQQLTSFWPSLGNTPEDRLKRWQDIVAAKRAAEDASISATRPLVVVGLEETEPGITVPQESHSAWQLYRRHLLGQDWKQAAVDGIETSALRILRHLRKSTLGQGPVKGLVVGHVQSGKTASMAGLIAMAADQGWNLFIVLSGTLENLRVQTKKRIFKDLNHPGNLHWQVEDHPSRNSVTGRQAQDKQLQPGSPARHLIVSLKNTTRLESLLAWLKADPISMKKMKILIIDDEADQAGINSADVSKDERTKINRLIIALANIPALSVNYVAYTATPAANFLNESPGVAALYPDDFIVCLQQSDEHFGPLQIFGAPEEGYDPLGIIREINHDDLVSMRDLHTDATTDLPESLQEAVVWFLCSVAALRVKGFRKPVSMLIHTSQRQAHHENVGDAVRVFLNNAHSNLPAFMKQAKAIWESVKTDLDTALFAERFPLYGRLTEIADYPEFKAVRAELPALLGEISAIRLDESKDMTYHSGVHVCIDNCANNGISDENEIRRLFYPSADAPNQPSIATAFIVIGGSTLSRGLTLENLVSTYFLRASAQADSLMQMGRWFGYRKGYELLPRIWMPDDTRRKFEFMTLAEEDLRDDLQRFMYAGAKPSEFGPRVRVSPRASWLRPTAKNRMQQSVPCDYDFSGVSRQTTIFHDGEGAGEAHLHNRHQTEAFLIAQRDPHFAERGTAIVWRGVEFDEIANFLGTFRFHPNAQFFSEITAFLQWYREHGQEAGYGAWNVVAAGNKLVEGRGWKLPSGDIGMISRSRVPKRSSNGAVSVGVLRDPRDLLADAQLGETMPPKRLTNELVSEMRAQGGVGHVPQLLLYLIDKDSEPRDQDIAGDGEDREPLRAAEHIVGISIWLPGSGGTKRSFVSHVTVRIPADLDGADDDADPEEN
jgi:hypothetical protein